VKFYTSKIFKLCQKEWVIVMTLFFVELKNEGSRITYLLDDFSESKDRTKSIMRFAVSFMLFIVVPYLKPKGSFVYILCASYGALMLHIF